MGVGSWELPTATFELPATILSLSGGWPREGLGNKGKPGGVGHNDAWRLWWEMGDGGWELVGNAGKLRGTNLCWDQM